MIEDDFKPKFVEPKFVEPIPLWYYEPDNVLSVQYDLLKPHVSLQPSPPPDFNEVLKSVLDTNAKLRKQNTIAEMQIDQSKAKIQELETENSSLKRENESYKDSIKVYVFDLDICKNDLHQLELEYEEEKRCHQKEIETLLIEIAELKKSLGDF